MGHAASRVFLDLDLRLPDVYRELSNRALETVAPWDAMMGPANEED